MSGLVVLVVLMVAPAASAQQNWLLTSDSAGAPLGADLRLILHNGGSTGSAGTALLVGGGTLTWATQEQAVAPLDMSGTWTVALSWTDVLTPVAADDLRFTLGVLGTDNLFRAVHQPIAPNGNGLATPAPVAAGDYTVQSNERLAIQVSNTDLTAPASMSLSATADQSTGSSSARQPLTSPNFPVPEFASVALLGVGIMLTAGLVKHRKRRQ